MNMAYCITLKCGERINPMTLDVDPLALDDSFLPSPRKSTANMAKFKKNFNVEHGSCVVPAAEVHECPEEENQNSYKFPRELVVFKPMKPDDYDEIVEYDYDDEDYNWLELLNDERKQKKEVGIPLDTFETIMDRLEKESVFEIKPSASMVPGSSAESDDVCCVCCDGETTNTNQIIYCDMCNIAVHQDCYGVPYIPEGQWLCRRCKISPSSPVNCCLCPNTAGAFKQTSDGRWAHVICAIWLNEVHFANAVFLEPIEGVENSLRKRAKLKCLVCRQKMGACLQCSTRSCLKAFHVTCAQNSGMSMRVISVEDDRVDDGMDVQRFIYCHLHTGEDESLDKNERKKRMENAVRNARRAMENKAKATVDINMPMVSKEVLEGIVKRVDTRIHEVSEYWYLKRQSRCGAPLIKRLQVQLSTKRTVAVECLTEEDKKVCANVSRVRMEWENTRLLCELVKKRETLKYTHVITCSEMLEKMMSPIGISLENVLDELGLKDKENVFAKPVTAVEGYRSLIKRPMDLSTMRKKVLDGRIDSFDSLRADFTLMMDNCELFNSNHQWYLSYSKKFRKAGAVIINEAEEAHICRETRVLEDTEFARLIASVQFMESLVTLEEDGEGGVVLRRTTRTRRNSQSVIPATPSGPEKKAMFTTPQSFKPPGATPATPATTATKRRATDMFTPPSRVKKSKNHEASTPSRQSFITRYFTPNRPELRSATTTPAPLMAYRDNTAIKSPLPPETASESSADEEDGRRNRRSLRHFKSDSQSDSETALMHNDLVSVNGTAGRVIDPTQAMLEDQLPPQLIAECRSSRREKGTCVMLFDTENKWGWYPPSEIKPLDLNGPNENVSSSSQRLARQWAKRTMDQYR